jgi:dihydropteroate synthase
MADVVAQTGVTYVAMHWRGPSSTMAARATYDDVVAEVRRELTARVAALLRAGVDEHQIVLDPGLGFAKTADHDWALLRRLPALTSLGFPVLVGASRKSFLGSAAADLDGTVRPAADRDALTCAFTSLAVAAGATWVRVHDVAANRDAALVGSRWRGEPLTPGRAPARPGRSSSATRRTPPRHRSRR